MTKKNLTRIVLTVVVLGVLVGFSLVNQSRMASAGLAGYSYCGEIALFSFKHPPRGWMTCEGQLLRREYYLTLFELIGNKYGGNGTNTFALPNLAAPVPGMQYCICVEGNYPGPQ